MNTFSDFLAMVQPFFDLATDLLTVPLFGVPVWRYIFSIYLFSFVAGFVSRGAVSLGGFTNAAGAFDGFAAPSSGSSASNSYLALPSRASSFGQRNRSAYDNYSFSHGRVYLSSDDYTVI